jgi:YHS domain-containing protein
MRDLHDFNSRLEAEFALLPTAIEQRRSLIDHVCHERRQRFAEEFIPAVAKVREIWRPRSDALIARFKDIIHVQADVRDDFSRIVFSFDSPLARVTLSFDFSHDQEVRNMILDYDLEILPILMKFDNHSTLKLPLASFDDQAAAEWLESRLISFIHSYVELNENQYYLQGQMVQDPVARIRMPKAVARETLELDGHTYYFISAETRREFEKQRLYKQRLAAAVEKKHALHQERIEERNDLGGEA